MENGISYTDIEHYPWWAADMGETKLITKIVTYKREDCCANEMTDYEIRVGDDPDILNNPACPGIYTGSRTINCNLAGRYIGLIIPNSFSQLSICEIEAFESNGTIPAQPVPLYLNTDDNLLKNATASQSSTAEITRSQASNAIDGEKAKCTWQNSDADNSISATNSDSYAWWQADMGVTRFAKYVVVYNREDEYAYLLQDYEVRVGDDVNMFNNPPCPGVHVGSKIIECGLAGRYVGILLPRSAASQLSLCEVEVYERTKPTKTGINLLNGAVAFQSTTRYTPDESYSGKAQNAID